MGDGTSLGRVRGHGSAKDGTEHWWHQRLSAGSNLILMAWFLASLAWLPGYDYATLSMWIGSPWAAVPMILLVLSVFTHFRLGLQVAIEDYLHDLSRIVLLVLLDYCTLTAIVLAIFSILRIAFTATTGAPA